MKVIGVDIGTTSISGTVIDVKTGKTNKVLSKNSNAFIKSNNSWEKIQSVEKIITIALDIINKLIDDDVVSIGITGQMHGILYIDSEGYAVTPLYCWQDERGNLPYKGTTYAKYLNSFTGYGNVTDFYNRENDIVPQNAKSYCTISDYLVMKLCRLKTPLIHSTNAASLGCYDLIQNRFNYDCNISVTSDYCIAGEYKGIPVSVAIGDNQASVFSTLSNEDDILVNVGTGSQISIVSDEIVFGENIDVRPYFEDKYLIVGASLCGGRAYSILKNFYRKILSYISDVDDEEVYKIMNSMLDDMGKTSLIVDTRFAGTRKNACLCGSINCITENNFNPGEITYGVLEGIAEELHEMYREMGIPKIGMVGSGNGIRRNIALTKIFEQKFSTKIKIPIHNEEAAYGAAMFSLISCKIFKNAKDAQKMIKYIEE